MNKVFKHTIEIPKLQNDKGLQEIENYKEKHITPKYIKIVGHK